MSINFTNNYPQNITFQRKNLSFKATPAQFSSELKSMISSTKKEPAAQKNLVETFKEILSQITKQENKVGSGEFGAVYKIDDEFVLKTALNKENNLGEFNLNDTSFSEKFKTYYGDFVAKIGDFKFLKNAAKTNDSLCAGVKEGIFDSAQKMNYYREVYLNRFSKMPQKAFDEVAQDFKTASEFRKSFDTINPNNFLADGENIRILDDLQTPDDKFFNSFAGMVKVFLTSFDRNTKAEYDVLAVGSRRNLLRKIILASEKNELRFGASSAEREEINHALNLCDIQTPWREIQSDLCDMRRKYPDMSERLKKINEYMTEVENPQYNPFMY